MSAQANALLPSGLMDANVNKTDVVKCSDPYSFTDASDEVKLAPRVDPFLSQMINKQIEQLKASRDANADSNVNESVASNSNAQHNLTRDSLEYKLCFQDFMLRGLIRSSASYRGYPDPFFCSPGNILPTSKPNSINGYLENVLLGLNSFEDDFETNPDLIREPARHDLKTFNESEFLTEESKREQKFEPSHFSASNPELLTKNCEPREHNLSSSHTLPDKKPQYDLPFQYNSDLIDHDLQRAYGLLSTDFNKDYFPNQFLNEPNRRTNTQEIKNMQLLNFDGRKQKIRKLNPVKRKGIYFVTIFLVWYFVILVYMYDVINQVSRLLKVNDIKT